YEQELARTDGCEFRFQCRPTRILGNGQVTGLEVETPQGTEVIACDMVITALGQEALGGFTLPTDHPKVFAGGDFANGGAEIVNAAAEGGRAGAGIHLRLTEEGGRGREKTGEDGGRRERREPMAALGQ